jgi:hypothetical protein
MKIHWYQKINPIWWFGNIDDPPPIGYTDWTWFLRNPFHNLFFYAIGVADQPSRTWRSTYGTSNTFNPNGGFGMAVTNGCLPYICYRGKRIEAYIGWRPIGAFGIALRRTKAKGP